MAERRNVAMEISTALGRADAQTLGMVAVELLASLSRAEATIAELRDAEAKRLAVEEARRRKDRERKPLRGFPRIPRKSEERSELDCTTRSTTTTQSSSSAREELLTSVPNRRAWEGEIAMAQDGARGAMYKATDEQVETACRDYLGNGASSAPNLAQFRAYLKRAVSGERPPTPARRGGVGQRSHDNALEALKDVG